MKRLLIALLFAVSVQADTNVLTWNASATPNVTYNLYRKDGPCSSSTGTFVKVNTAPITGLTFTDTAAPAGKACYEAEAVDADGVASVRSNQVSLPRPAPPTNLRGN